MVFLCLHLYDKECYLLSHTDTYTWVDRQMDGQMPGCPIILVVSQLTVWGNKTKQAEKLRQGHFLFDKSLRFTFKSCQVCMGWKCLKCPTGPLFTIHYYNFSVSIMSLCKSCFQCKSRDKPRNVNWLMTLKCPTPTGKSMQTFSISDFPVETRELQATRHTVINS